MLPSIARHALLSLALTALAASPAAAEKLRVGKAGREAFSFVPLDIGVRSGIFTRHGLDVEISNFGGDARLQQAMAADGVDISLGSGPGLAFIVTHIVIRGADHVAGITFLNQFGYRAPT